MKTHKKLSKGFTLTELMLAMGFLAFVLLFIVTAMVQYMNIYSKGVVMKDINQAGRTAFEEITRNVRINSANVRQMLNGRLCAGSQAYIWNTESTQNKYTTGERIEGLIRVPDSAGELCAADAAGGLAPVSRANEAVIAGAAVGVQSFSARKSDGLYELSLTLSTVGDNKPINGTNECPPGKAGEYCAVATFSTMVAARN